VQRIAESEERYRLLAENAADIVGVMKDGVIDWISPSVEAAFGAPPSDWLGQPGLDVIHPDNVQAFQDSLAAAGRGEGGTYRGRMIGPNGAEHWVEVHGRPYIEADGRLSGVIASIRVIDEVIEVEAELDRRARYDSLTCLLNRSEILQTITQVATRTPRSGTRTAVLFCDVDRFKDINDEHGHACGDEVLRTVGERVAATIRADDYAARIGGDELLILLQGVHSLDEALEVAEKIRSVAAQRIALDHGVGVAPQLSIGVTLLRPGETTDELVERADSAMYLAKKSGRNRVVAV
jgi:diguanylate cyclase (GGDEF)-like protein/PAS domain S-box-containing protein